MTDLGSLGQSGAEGTTIVRGSLRITRGVRSQMFPITRKAIKYDLFPARSRLWLQACFEQITVGRSIG